MRGLGCGLIAAHLAGSGTQRMEKSDERTQHQGSNGARRNGRGGGVLRAQVRGSSRLQRGDPSAQSGSVVDAATAVVRQVAGQGVAASAAMGPGSASVAV